MRACQCAVSESRSGRRLCTCPQTTPNRDSPRVRYQTARSKYKSTHILHPLLTLLLILAQAANLVQGGCNVDTEARAVLTSLLPETTLLGVCNTCDTILWLDRQLDEFNKAAEEDAGGVEDWGVGGGVGEGEGEGDDENEEGEEEEVVDELDE